jgi:two-component system, OmpR family, sensor histidine kinase KdpD
MSTPAEKVSYVRADDLLADPVAPPRAPLGGLGRRRHLTGAVVAILGLPLLTLLLESTRSTFSLESQVLLYLLAVVIIAVIGGLAVAVASAVAAAFLINYFFVKPEHTLEVAQGEQALALAVFLIVAAIVSWAVEAAARRARAAERAAQQAETLSGLAHSDFERGDTLRQVLERARTTFGMESVTLSAREHSSGDWADVESAGWGPPGEEAPLRFDVPIGTELRLIGRGPALFAEDQRVLQAFASAAETAYQGHRLSERAGQARELATADRQRTALLAAVGHDLRTPLAGIKASVSTLRQTDVDWSDVERSELLAAIEESADRLDAIVENLLDASRLEAGVLSVQPVPVALDEVIAAALLAVPGARETVSVDVPEDLPLVQADPGLLERVVANLLENAVRHGGGAPVQVTATAGDLDARIKIVDHGPGVPEAERERLFQAFQRADGGSPQGAGLGLTVARGFSEAMDGALIADGSDGGGLTMRLRLPLAR